MPSQSVPIILEPCVVPDVPTNEDMVRMAVMYQERLHLSQIQDPDGGIRRVTNEEKVEPLVALTKMAARKAFLEQSHASNADFLNALNALKANIADLEQRLSEVFSGHRNALARKTNKKALQMYEDRIAQDGHVDKHKAINLSKLYTAQCTADDNFPSTVGDLYGLSLDTLRSLNETYKFTHHKLVQDESSLLLRFKAFITTDE